ncbi:hypothetical protein [Thermogutta sp.]|uniref:hypothetical protein n=1 Tax=Thermogutta sp. TaxID=1962930 RepID=UPI00321F9F92
MVFEIVVRVIATAWLVVLSVLDVRRHRLPHPLTTIPLIVIGLLAMGCMLVNLRDGWSQFVADPLALVLAFVAILASDTLLALIPAAGALATAFCCGTSAGQIAATGWLVALALAKSGIMGAGDSKVTMLLLALSPDVRLVICLGLAVVVIGGALLTWRVGWATPWLILSVVRDGLAGRFPSRTGEKGVLRVPLVPILAAGALVYLWLVWRVG